MKVAVKLFAAARDLAGSEEVTLDIPEGSTVSDLRTELAGEFSQLAELLPHALIAVDTCYARNSDVIARDAEIALIPPVSGG